MDSRILLDPAASGSKADNSSGLRAADRSVSGNKSVQMTFTFHRLSLHLSHLVFRQFYFFFFAEIIFHQHHFVFVGFFFFNRVFADTEANVSPS